MKKALALFALSIIGIFAHAQTNYDVLRENVELSDFIVEGKVVQKNSFQDVQSREIMTAYKVAVTTKIKGLISDTITIVTKGGTLNGETSSISHGVKMRIDEYGIFLLEDYNHDHFKLYNGTLGKIRRLFNDPKAEVYHEGARKKYKSWRKIKEQIGNWSGKDLSIQPITNKESLFTLNNNPELCVQLANVIPDVLNSKLEFDLLIKSDVAGLPFASREVLVDYPIAHLGANIVFNNKIEVSKEIVSADEDYIMTVQDINQDRMKIDFQTGCLAGENYYILGTEFEKLAHVILDVQNWGNQGTLNLNQLEGQAKYFLAEDGCLDFYDICYGGQVSFMTCNVTDVTASPYGAGIDQTITITGTNFGTTAGIGSKITVPDPDDGGDTDFDIIGNSIGNDNIISWTDTEIQMKLSSLNNTLEKTVGSGTWTIFPDINASNPNTLACDLVIDIDYSLQNDNDLQGEKMIGFAQNSYVIPNGDFEWYLDLDIDSDLQAQGITFNMVESVAMSAFCDWEVATGIEFTYKGGISNGQTANDNLNIVHFAPLVEPAETTVRHTEGEFCSGNEFFEERFDEADIALNVNTNWFVSTGTGISGMRMDLYSVLIHEIGHAILLKHSMDTDETNGSDDSRIMYFGLLPEQIKRNIDLETVNGVDLLVQRTKLELGTGGCFDGSLLNTTPTGCTTPIKSIKLNNCNYKIVDNLLTKGETIQITNTSKVSNYQFFDINGRILYHSSQNISNGNVNIPTGDINSGVYFVRIECSGQRFIEKIVIQ